MAKKGPLAIAKDRAWRACSIYIRTRGSHDGYNKCVTCGDLKLITDLDAGHFIPKTAGNAVLFVEANIWPQCRYCNRMLEGNRYNYSLWMLEKFGKDECDKLDALRRVRVDFRIKDYQDFEAYFKEALKAL